MSIVGNRSTEPHGAAIACTNSRVLLDHCTIADNYAGQQGAALRLVNSEVSLTNSIVWGNHPGEILLDILSYASIAYTDIGSGNTGLGNLNTDPLFARRGYWVDLSDPQAVWMEGDYHLQSQAGRWDPITGTWTRDDVTSPCIDAGNPMGPVGPEPAPNGGRANLGAYGTSTQASKSP